jgi:hypothetical protein
MLPSSLFCNSPQVFAILNTVCSHVWIITAPALYIYIYMLTPFMFARYFYSELELFHVITCIKERQDALRQTICHILTRVAKCIEDDGGIFETVLC